MTSGGTAGRLVAGALLACAILAGGVSCSANPTGTIPLDPARTPTAATETSSGPTVADPAGFHAELKVGRMDQANRILTVTVRNESGADVRITDATFDADWYPTDVPVRRAGLLRDGAALALAFPLADAACEPGSAPASGARARLQLEDGRTVLVRPVDTYQALADLYDQDCAAEVLAEAGTLAFGDTLSVTDRNGVLIGSLDLTFTPASPGGDGPVVSVVELERTTLIVPVDGETWRPTGMNTSTNGPVTVPIELVPARCDPHAVAEDKRGTYLPTTIEVDGVAAPLVYTAVSPQVRGQIYDFVARSCGWQ